MNYQINQVAPYFIKRHILRRKGLKEPQLYKFDREEYTSGGSESEEVKTA